MRFTRWLLRYIAVFSGLGTGFAKVMEMPGEVVTYGAVGFGPEVLYLFGAVQIGAAFLMLFQRTRTAAGVLLAATFGVLSYLLLNIDALSMGLIEAGLSLITLIAAFWTRDVALRRNGYVRPGSEIWR